MTTVPHVQFECKKDALRQMQEGHWKIQLTVHPNDMPAELLSAAMGQRFIAVLAAVGDDEQAVKLEAKPEKSDGERAVTRAALLCQDEEFQEWIPKSFIGNPGPDFDPDVAIRGYTDKTEYAADYVRHVCGVTSRSEIAHDPDALRKFLDIEEEFRRRDQIR